MQSAIFTMSDSFMSVLRLNHRFNFRFMSGLCHFMTTDIVHILLHPLYGHTVSNCHQVCHFYVRFMFVMCSFYDRFFPFYARLMNVLCLFQSFFDSQKKLCHEVQLTVLAVTLITLARSFTLNTFCTRVGSHSAGSG